MAESSSEDDGWEDPKKGGKAAAKDAPDLADGGPDPASSDDDWNSKKIEKYDSEEVRKNGHGIPKHVFYLMPPFG